MRRMILVVVVVAIMAAMLVGSGLSASAQMPGETVSCSPWQQEWHQNDNGWWWYWWYRWCYNPSIQGAWYQDWDGWEWA